MCMINKADWSISLIISLLTGYTRSDFLWLYLHMYVVYVTCGILPSPPPFPKDYYYIIIKSKRFNHVKNKDNNRTRRACPSHHQCSPFCRCGRSRVSPDSLRFQPAPACSPCCSEIFAVSLTADQLLVARMAVSEIKCNKNLVQLQKRNKSSC